MAKPGLNLNVTQNVKRTKFKTKPRTFKIHYQMVYLEDFKHPVNHNLQASESKFIGTMHPFWKTLIDR